MKDINMMNVFINAVYSKEILYASLVVVLLIILIVCVLIYTRMQIRKATKKIRDNNESLSMSLAKYQTIFDSMLVGVEHYDKNGILVDINERAMELYGMTETKSQFMSRKVDCHANPNMITLEIEQILSGNDYIGVVDYDFDLVNKVGYYPTKNHGTRQLETKISPIFNEDHKFKGFIILTTDVTDVSQYQKQLENSKNQAEEISLMFASILDQSPCAMFIKDVEDDYRYIVANERFSYTQNCDASMIVGKTDFELFSNEDATKFRFDDERCVSDNEAHSFIEEVEWRGHIIWHTTKVPITTTNGRKLLVGVSLDITESMMRQKSLEEYKIKTGMAIAAGGLVPWEYDCETNQFLVDDGNTHLDVAKLILDEYSKLANAEGKAEIARATEIMQRGRDESFTVNLKYKHGGNNGYRYATVAASPFAKDKSGKVTRFIGFHKDTTQWAQLNEEIDKSNKMLNNFIQQIPMGLFVKDVEDDYRYVVANEILTRINYMGSSELIGKTDYDVFDKPLADMFRNQDTDVVSRYDGEAIVSRSEAIYNGAKLIYEVTDTVITTGTGHRFLMGITADITEQELYKTELQEAKERAEQSDILKSAFLANMSHEIRTPLNAIVGFSGLLASAETDEEKSEYNKLIDTNSTMLLRLINDILDMSKVEAGMVNFKRERFDMSAYFEELASSMRQRCVNPDVELIVDNPYPSCIVEFDKNRVAQVVTNYVTNAIKYTVKGSITMGYSCVDGGVRIYVSDTGIGISKEKQTRVFQRFEKLDEFAQGTGLGLSICRAITEVDGGKVGFESNDGAGSTFWAWKPSATIIIQEAETVEENAVSQVVGDEPYDISGINVLIAEDKDSNFLLLKYILKDCRVHHVINGAEAVDKVRTDEFDIVLMDMKMPVMDGLTAVRHIREFNRSLPIIAVTANAFDSDKAEAMAAGCNGFTAKPIKKNELFSVMRNVLSAREA